MKDIWEPPYKSIIDAHNYIFLMCFDSEKKRKKSVRHCFRKLFWTKKPFERSLCKWQGYYCYECRDERYEDFALAAFCLTKRRLYVAYELLSKMQLTTLKIGPYTSYDIDCSCDGEMTSFALCSGEIVYFLYNRDDALTGKLKQKMRKIGVPTLRESLKEILKPKAVL